MSATGDVKRAWLLAADNHSDVLPDGTRVYAPGGVYLLYFTVGRALTPGATYVAEAFDRENQIKAYHEALLQLVLVTVSELRARANSAADTGGAGGGCKDAAGAGQPPPPKLGYDGDPIRVFFETVLAEEEDDVDDEEEEEHHHHHRGPDAVDTSVLDTELESMVLGTRVGRNASQPYNRNVSDKTELVEYRVWVAVLDAALDFGATLMNIVKENQRAYLVATNPSVFRAAGGGGGRRGGGGGGGGGGSGGGRQDDGEASVAASLSTYAGGAPPRYAAALGECEKFRLINSLGKLALVCDMLLGLTALSLPAVADKIASARTPLADNPVHPRVSLSPLNYFRAPTGTACEAQRTLARYYDAATQTWGFPHADRVLVVTAELQSVARFMRMYLPRYQQLSLTHALNLSALRLPRHLHVPGGGRGRRNKGGDGGDGGERPGERAIGVSELTAEEVRELAAYMGVNEAEAYAVAGGERVVLGEAEHARDGVRVLVSRDAGGLNVDALNTFDDAVLAREDFEDDNALATQRELHGADSPSRSALHALVWEGARLRRLFNVLAPELSRARRRHEYLAVCTRQAQLYADQCCLRSSNVSRVGKELNDWFTQRVHVAGGLACERGAHAAWMGVEYTSLDARLSVFALMQARRMLQLETCAHASTCHSKLLAVVNARHGAYRHRFGVLLTNYLLRGANSTSKSYMLQQMTAWCAPNTVKVYTHETKAARTGDVDMNDEINVCEEVNPKLVYRDRDGGDERYRAQFKDLLTAQIVSACVFFTNSQGRRGSRVTHSQQIGAYFYGSNAPLDAFDPAIASRFRMVQCVVQARDKRAPADLQNIVDRLDARGQLRVTLARDEAHMDQFTQYHVHKFIAVGALTDVSLSVFHASVRIFRVHLEECFSTEVVVRALQRLENDVRLAVISHAVVCVFSCPASPLYRTPFAPLALRACDPLLHDSLEMCLFFFGMERDTLVSAVRTTVLRLLGAQEPVPALAYGGGGAGGISAGERALQRAEAVYLTPDTRLVAAHGRYGVLAPVAYAQRVPIRAGPRFHRGGAAPAAAAAAAPAPPPPLVREGEHDALSQSLAAMAGVRAADSDTVTGAQHWAYLRVTGGVGDIARRLANATTEDKSGMRLEPKDTNEAILELTRVNIRARAYGWSPTAARPEPVNAERYEHMVPAAFLSGANNEELYVHLDLVRGARDAVEEAIELCLSRHTKPAHYLDARVVDERHPYLFRLRDVRPVPNRDTRLYDIAAQVTPAMRALYPALYPADEPLFDGESTLDVSLDEYGVRERARRLHLDLDDAAQLDTCRFDRYNAAMAATAAPGARYPDDLIERPSVARRRATLSAALRGERL